MQLGEIKDQDLIHEYIGHLQSAISVAKDLRTDPANSKYAANLSLIIAKLERLVTDTEQGKIMNEIAGLTKFASDWPIARAKLALAIWEAERFFSERVLRLVMKEVGRT